MYPDRPTALTRADVRALAQQQKTAMPHLTDAVLAYGVAWEVAMILLGRRVFDAVRGGLDEYLGPGSAEGGLTAHQHRMVQLGLHLLECQSIGNFEAMRADMASRTFSGVAHELRCGAVAIRSGFDVQFVSRSGTRGSDFDFMLDGRIALETKAKKDGLSYSRSSMHSTLGMARRQLPKDGPGVIMVAVPDGWGAVPSFHSELDDTVNGVLRNTGRVVGVIVVWDQYVTLGPTGFATIRRVRRFANPGTRYPGDAGVLGALYQGMRVDRVSAEWLSEAGLDPSSIS